MNVTATKSLSYEFFRLEEALEMTHLPSTHEQEDASLPQGPPKHPGVCAFTRLSEPFFPILQKIRVMNEYLAGRSCHM